MERYFERDIYKKMLEWKGWRDKHLILQSLEISGPRQCGKTTVIDKFAKENYKNVVSINLGKDETLTVVRNWENRVVVRTPDGGIGNFLRLFSDNFVDSPDTVIVIDEIQESHHVHRLIRQITRELKSHLIVSGSYLGRVVRSKDFSIPAGDLYKLKMTTLTFEEFLGAFGRRKMWESLDLYGNSSMGDYDKIMELFRTYVRIGGYPAVVSVYLKGGDESIIDSMLFGLIATFTEESTKYLEGIIDANIFDTLFEGVSHLILDEKRGTFFFMEELTKIVYKKHKSLFSEKSVTSVVNWLIRCGVLSMCSLANNCDLDSLRPSARLYFTDLGVARLFLRKIRISDETLNGILFENFVFLCLLRTLLEQDLIPNVPTFGRYMDGEIDFVLESKSKGTTYAIEVKSGKNKSKTVDVLLNNGIVNKVLFAKGNTYGGVDGDKITIPVSLFSRYDFNSAIISSPVVQKMTAFD
jgi:predicted AAA+ superfamily ATPase